MKREPERFGWTAPVAPTVPALPKVPMDLDFLVKSDTSPETDEPGDPVWSFIKAQADAELAKGSCTITDEQLTSLMCTPADVRSPVSLAKAAAGDDWAWDTDAPMSKRASPAKERFRRQLEEFFPNHEEEISEAVEVAGELSAMLAEEAA
jgi:hypothetical protein